MKNNNHKKKLTDSGADTHREREREEEMEEEELS